MMTFSCLQTLTETSALPGFWACSPSDSDWNYTAALLGLQLASYRPWGLISLRDCVCHFFIISISLPLSLFLLVLFLWRILVKMGGKCCVPSHSVVSDSLRPHGLQPTRLLCPWGFSRQEYWSGLLRPPSGDLPNPGIELRSPTLQADSLPLSHQGSPGSAGGNENKRQAVSR